ncbi:hypothetical protein [Erythrobacter sp.]|uniref:hypothetical protein n=1 Tax=Erythrobacter sp. TaxID=1042 RepID=UPI001425C8C0|nr:hypothetical protein [Erythrobacter sp.]QIQ85500.1 MAG: hypothetical protein G9473_01490 [Erythrobacter sp.]
MGELIPLFGIVFGCMIPISVIWSKHRERVAEMQIGTTAAQTAEKAAQYAAQVQRLEDRVQVLERIVTDRGYDVATQIEALRDTRTVESGGGEEKGSGVPLDIESREKA